MTCTANRKRRRGLTLIELTATLVLLSILMASLSGLLPRFVDRAADQQAAARLHEIHWARVAVERLADDLANADEAQIDGTTLTLSGRLHRDPVSGRMTDRTSTCSYSIVPLPERMMLVREQHRRKSLIGVGRMALSFETRLADGKFATPQVVNGISSGPAESRPLELAPCMRIVLLDESGQTLAATELFR